MTFLGSGWLVLAFYLFYFIKKLQDMGCGITHGIVSGPFLLNCIKFPINADHSRFIFHVIESSKALRLIFYMGFFCRILEMC